MIAKKGIKYKLPLTYVISTVMERDRRLTGFLRGQTDQVKAPAGFEVSNPWKVREAVDALSPYRS